MTEQSRATPLFLGIVLVGAVAPLLITETLNPTAIVLGGSMFVVGLCIYLSPSLLAYHQKHPSAHAILAINALLGWMVIPWVIALAWALKRPDAAPASKIDAELVRCPHCDELIRPAAVKCKHCGSVLAGSASTPT